MKCAYRSLCWTIRSGLRSRETGSDQGQPEQAESKDQKLGEAHAEGLEQAEMHQQDSQ